MNGCLLCLAKFRLIRIFLNVEEFKTNLIITNKTEKGGSVKNL